MPPAPGTRIGPYEIVSLLGEGGMGQVYRARDTKLERDVAIKVLPASFAEDADRVARFTREAKVLASLNHPSIAAIYGIQETHDTTALVMELVDGEDLSELIGRGRPEAASVREQLSDSASAAKRRGWGPAETKQGRRVNDAVSPSRDPKRGLSLDEALPIARQMAEALEAAHEQGIIHRDLKPANIKVRGDGTVKVLDFGLAKALDAPGAAPGGPNVSQSPTITSPAMTQMGMILGTAAYMSPEQARGKPVDRRADIWAFGCVLYEMFTGARAFPGEDITDTLAAVVRSEPDWNRLPGDVPPTLLVFLRRCLEKDPRQRVGDIHDVRLALEGAFDTPSAQQASIAAPPPSRGLLPLAAAVAAGAALAVLAAWTLWPTPAPRPLNQFAYVVPEDQPFRRAGRPVMAVSRDGRSFVYNTTRGLFLRTLDDFDARVLPGTEEDIADPFFSPDGQWVGYWASATNELKRIAVDGGPPVSIGPAAITLGASWGSDGRILFGQADGIYRVAPAGGTPERVIAAAEGERLFGPQLLPDGDTVLFTAATSPSWTPMSVVAQRISGGDRTMLVDRGSDARYLPTGHLAYADGNALFGVGFDLDRLTTSGTPVPLAQGLMRVVGSNSTPTANYSVSDDGTLFWVRSDAFGTGDRGLVWVDRNGQTTALPTPPRHYVGLSLSPDGQRAALQIENDVSAASEIWVTDLPRGTLLRIAGEDGNVQGPLWSPDGRRVVFSALRDGRAELRSKLVDAAGPSDLLSSPGDAFRAAMPWSWAADGSAVAAAVRSNVDVTSPSAVGLASANGSAGWRPLMDQAQQPEISPDGRWIAYVSTVASARAGLIQVYIARLPGLGDERQVSVSSEPSHQPTWSPDGRALFYLEGMPATIVRRVSVEASESGSPVIGTPERWVDYRYWSRPATDRVFDVAPDGQRILAIASPDQANGRPVASRINIVQNWVEELKRLVPTH